MCASGYGAGGRASIRLSLAVTFRQTRAAAPDRKAPLQQAEGPMVERNERKPYWRHTKAQMLAILIVIAGVVIAYPHPPILALFVIGVVAMVGFPIWFFPYSRTLWVAIDLAMTPLEFGEGVDPQWELAADIEGLLAERHGS